MIRDITYGADGHRRDSSVYRIKQSPSLDGERYVVTLEVGLKVITLTPDRAQRYAINLFTAAHRAAYDAGLFRQLIIGRQSPVLLAGLLIARLAADREPIEALPGELSFEPCVDRVLSPVIVVRMDGKQVGRWDFSTALTQATAILSRVIAADLDGGYYRYLTSGGAPEARAREAIEDHRSWRSELAALG